MGIRTPDLLHAMQALYQLSYSPSGAEASGRGAPLVYKKSVRLRRRAACRPADTLVTGSASPGGR